MATDPVGTTAPAKPIRLDSASEVAEDSSAAEASLTDRQWLRLADQRDRMIDAMIKLFTTLNGAVYVFVLVAWAAGLFDKSYRIVDGQTVMTLIGATVVQAGIAFVAITRFLFPSRESPG